MNRYAFISLPALLLGIGLAACDSGDGGPQSQPIPVLLGINPDTVIRSDSNTDIILEGEAFTAQSRARWNGEDRPTGHVSGSRLTMTLHASDVALTGDGVIEVVNPPPGGGTSGRLTAVIVNARPAITSVSPTTIQLGDTTTVITVIGTGFYPHSAVNIGGTFLQRTTYVTSTQMNARLSGGQGFQIPPAGTQPLRVYNQYPGGGESNAIEVSVRNATATVSSIIPDSAATDQSPLPFAVTGTGFVNGAIIRYNGLDRPTTFASSTRLTTQLNASHLAAPGNYPVTVLNPFADLSTAVNFRVYQAPPRLTNLAPASVNAGGSDVVMTVTGRNFGPGSVVQWAGQPLATTFVSNTTLTASVPAANVAASGTALVTVRDPATSLTSVPLAFVILRGTPSITEERAVTLATHDIVYDSLRNRIYASVPNNGGAQANNIVSIDPSSGAISTLIANVHSDPGRLEISDDAAYLYVASRAARLVTRIDLATGAKDIDINTVNIVEDMLTLPGSPRAVLTSVQNVGSSPRHGGVFMYDDATQRTLFTQGHQGSNRITRGPNSQAFYGYNNETTEFGFRRVRVLANGLQEDEVRGGLIGGFGVDIESDSRYVYATTGSLIDVETMSQVGSYPVTGIVRPDAANGRVHFFGGGTLHTFQNATLTNIGTLPVPNAGAALKMIRWGPDGLAFRSATQVLLIRSGLVGG